MSKQWFQNLCPECKAENWIYDGDSDDLTVEDIAAVQCWGCGHRWWTAMRLGEEECADLIGVEVEELSAALAADPSDQGFIMAVGVKRPGSG